MSDHQAFMSSAAGQGVYQSEAISGCEISMKVQPRNLSNDTPDTFLDWSVLC